MDRAKNYGIDFGLSLEQYIRMAEDAGIGPEQIGRRRGEYCVGRLGDQGGYFVGNCRFITVEQNHKEKVQNGGHARASAKVRGKPNTKLAKRFILTSPEGVVYEGSNVSEFCRKHGLDQPNVSALCRGALKKHKGWTGEYNNGSK
jgi:hypothetical protein